MNLSSKNKKIYDSNIKNSNMILNQINNKNLFPDCNNYLT